MLLFFNNPIISLERKRQKPSISWFTPQIPEQPGLGQAKTRNQEFPALLPHGYLAWSTWDSIGNTVADTHDTHGTQSALL